MKKTIFTIILTFVICFCTKAQITNINLSLDSPCASLSLNTIENQNDFTIYPNPSNGVINIKGTFNQIGNIKIYDLKGSLVFKSSLPENNKQKTLNINYLKNGIYILSCKINSKITSKKLIMNKQ
jgi:hypothetical protein